MDDQEELPPKASANPTKAIAVALLAQLLMVGGFVLMRIDPLELIGANSAPVEQTTESEIEKKIEEAFVELEPIMITIGPVGANRQLRLEAYIQTRESEVDEINKKMPKILDSLNQYLRAVEVQDMVDPSALLRLRLHMLKRVQLAVGEQIIDDLLIRKFLIS